MADDSSKNDAHNIDVAEENAKPKRAYNRKPVAIHENGEKVTTIESPRAKTNEIHATQFPDLPAGFIWRVIVEEDVNFGTCYDVILMRKTRFSAKKIDSIRVAANSFHQFYQGTNLSDAQTLASVATTLWATRRDAIERKVNYGARVREMKRYAGDYDANHLLSERHTDSNN